MEDNSSNEDILNSEEKEAIRRYESGEQHYVSCFIDEDTIIAGYGDLEYDFEFPLPNSYIKKIYGTNSWHKWHEIKDKEKQ